MLTRRDFVRFAAGVLVGVGSQLVSGCIPASSAAAPATPPPALAASLALPTDKITAPLRVHPTNSRYFSDPSGKAVLLSGSHTWDSVQERSRTLPAPAFDFPGFVSFLQAHGHNCTILWRFELMYQSWLGLDNWYTARTPWKRTGPGNATDGLPRFDLSQFDQTFFDHLRSCAEQLWAANIYAIVELFDGNDLVGARSPKDGCPYTGANNINGIDDGYTSGQVGAGSMTMTAPNAITDVQDRLVRKMIDTLNDLPNIIWETSEEGDAGSIWWNEHMIQLVRGYEATKQFQHPVGFGALTGGTDQQLYASSADWIAPSSFPISTDNQGKVVLCDGDHIAHSAGPGMGAPPGDASFVWKALCLGSQALMMDSYRAYGTNNTCPNPVNDLCTGSSPTSTQWDPQRDQLGFALIYANKCRDLAAMTPEPGKASTGFAVVNDAAQGAEYLVYAPRGGTFTVDLSGSGAPLSVEWFNPESGKVITSSPVSRGSASQSFTAPLSGDAVLYLFDASGRVS